MAISASEWFFWVSYLPLLALCSLGDLWNSLSRGHDQPPYQQSIKGFIYFITLPLIFISHKPLVNMVKKKLVMSWWRGRLHKTSLVSFHVKWEKGRVETLALIMFLFDGNNRRTNVVAGGGYCVMTVLWVFTTWRKVTNTIALKLMDGLLKNDKSQGEWALLC